MRLSLLLSACVLLGCDPAPPVEDAGGGDDAGAADAGSVGVGGAHCDEPELLIEAIEVGVSITLFNPTDAAIVTEDRNYYLCRRPSYQQLTAVEAGVVIGPGERHVYPWPEDPVFEGTPAAGEVALYNAPAFRDAPPLIDYVCWGEGIGPNRRQPAESDGDWGGGCAPALSGTVLRRVPDTDGRSAASYDSTAAASPLACP